MKLTLLITALVATIATAAPSTTSPAKSGSDSLTHDERIKLQELSTKYGDLEMSLKEKYNVHFCNAEDMDTCDLKCAYYYDMSPEDALMSDECLDGDDAKAYRDARNDVMVYKEMLAGKYGENLP